MSASQHDPPLCRVSCKIATMFQLRRLVYSSHRGLGRLRAAALQAASSLVLLPALSCGTLPPRSILVITIDTLRADHLGCYGYPRCTSPNIDAIAEEGVLFLNAISSSATTAPAHASLFTGMLPFGHGIMMNGGGPIPDDLPTLAELLERNGYTTAAFVNTGWVFERAGLIRGFETFETTPQDLAGDAQNTVGNAVRWLEARESVAPVFMWVHLWDPHSPYEPATPARTSAFWDTRRVPHALERHGADLEMFGGDDRLLDELLMAYDGEIENVDQAIGWLHAIWVKEADGNPATTIITADHGEGLGSHNWLLHGKNVFQEQIRVPLILHSTEAEWKAGRRDHLVHHIDLLPTVIEIAGLDCEKPSSGIRGIPLTRLLSGNSDHRFENRHVLTQRRSFLEEGGAVEVQPALPLPRSLDDLLENAIAVNYEPGESIAIQDGRHKLILRTEMPDLFFDLDADPLELSNLADTGDPHEERLRSMLLEMIVHEGYLRVQPLPSLDPLHRSWLRQLGYAY